MTTIDGVLAVVGLWAVGATALAWRYWRQVGCWRQRYQQLQASRQAARGTLRGEVVDIFAEADKDASCDPP